MVTRSQKIRLAVFLIVSVSVLIISIAIVTGNRIFQKKFTYFIRYKDVSLTGLEIGSAVKYRGIRIGRIDDIYIDEQDITSVIVEITVEPDVPIKEDTEAVVNYIGITGLKMIELMGGTNESKRLAPNSFIIAGRSLVDEISGQAEIVVEKLELILNNIAELTDAGRRNQLFELIENTSRALAAFQELLDRNQLNFESTVMNVTSVTSRLDTFLLTSNQTMKDIRKITASGKLMATVNHVEKITSELERAELSALIAKMAEAIEQTNRTFTHLDLTLLKSRHDILSSAEILRESLENFNEFTRLISENPSLLLRSSQQEEIQVK